MNTSAFPPSPVPAAPLSDARFPPAAVMQRAQPPFDAHAWRALTDALPYGLLVFDAQSGQCLYASAAAATVWGVAAEQIERDPAALAGLMMQGDHDWSVSAQPWQPANCHAAFTCQINHAVRGIRQIAWQARPLILPDGRIVTQVTVDDVTERCTGLLELQAARAQAEEANRAKSRFLASMSHEIRTPMNGVLGMTELLLGTEMTSRQRRFADTVYRSGEALLEIINDILDYSKIEAGRLELQLEAAALPPLVEDVIDLLAPRAHQKRVELMCEISPDLPAAVQIDGARLRQVLTNLVSNAVKFTDTGEIIVRAEPAGAQFGAVAAPGTAWVRFSISDTGSGMTEAIQQRLFRAFEAGDASAARRVGGAGLGLVISQHLVRMMGGSISVRSAPGLGSTFSFCLPLAAAALPVLTTAAAAAAASLAAPAAGALMARRILIVDDNAVNRGILVQQLQRWGADCSVAVDGFQALAVMAQAAAAAKPVEAAVIDMQMPGISGVELAERMQQDPLLAGIPRLMLTSISAPGEIARARAAGVTVWLEKPARSTDLLKALAAALVPAQTLAQSCAEAQERPLSQHTAASLRGAILLVEDNPVNREIATAMLEATACSVTVAENGRQAIARLADQEFDLILMDCQMPEMDGYEAVGLIRAAKGGTSALAAAAIPVIALTANALTGDRERCLEAGFNDYLAKPFAEAALHGVLRKWLPSPASTGGAASPPAADAPDAPHVTDAAHASDASQVPDAAPAPAAPSAPDAAAAAPQPAAQAATAALDAATLDGLRTLAEKAAPGLFERLCQTYLSSAPGLFTQLRNAVESGDMEGARQAAHTLKSSHANFGAFAMRDVCIALEAAAKAGQASAAITLMHQAEIAFGLALTAVTALNSLSKEPS